MSRLFAVNVEKTILVSADSPMDAERIAEYEATWDDSEFDSIEVKEITKNEDIPKEWKGCVPYSDDEEERTCEEVIRGEKFHLNKKEFFLKREEHKKRVQEDTLPLFPPEPKPIPTLAVVVIIQNSDTGEFLLLQRTSPPYGWCLAGGKIDEGENEIAAAIREVKEETGLDVSESIRKVGNSSSYDERPIAIFFAESHNRKISLSDREHSAYMWVSKIPFGVPLAGRTEDFFKIAMEEM